MSTATPLTFIVMYVSNLAESTAFFTENLGFTASAKLDGNTFRYLEGGNGSIGLGLNVVGEDTPPAGTIELYFQPDQLEAFHATLQAKGTGVTPLRSFPFGSTFQLQAPDNLPLIVWRPAAQ